MVQRHPNILLPLIPNNQNHSSIYGLHHSSCKMSYSNLARMSNDSLYPHMNIFYLLIRIVILDVSAHLINSLVWKHYNQTDVSMILYLTFHTQLVQHKSF